MTDWFNIPGVQWGAFGLFIACCFLVIRGILIPRPTYKELKSANDEAIRRLTEENKTWKDAWATEQEARINRDKQFDVLIELARSNEALIRSIKGVDA